MRNRNWSLALLLTALAGCATPTRTVRLQVEGEERVLPLSRSPVTPVEVTPAEYHAAMVRLLPDLPLGPLLLGRGFQLAPEDWQPASNRKYRLSRLTLTGWPPSDMLYRMGRLTLAAWPPASAPELTRLYALWCERTGRPGDCLSLVGANLALDEKARQRLALHLAFGSVWEETKAAFSSMVDPLKVQLALTSYMAFYLFTLVAPEPVTKAIAVALTAYLLSYLGWDTFWGLYSGYSDLQQAASRATTFPELRQAGERYAKVIGPRAARLFVMLATAAFGSAGLASSGPTLPGFTQASLVAETQFGFRLAAVSEISSITVSASGVAIALAPGAVAMVAQGTPPAANQSSTQCTGQVHHPISTRIARKLADHPTLKGRYTAQDKRFETRARTKADHWGYQKWHRDVDDEVIAWLDSNRFVTPERFEAELRRIYSTPEMKQRFPCGF